MADFDLANVGVIEPTLFDMGPVEAQVIVMPPKPKLSAGRRRTLRQAEAIARGGHPLGLVFADVRVHPAAEGRTATRDNAGERPLRCGTCRFRRVLGGYAKCTWERPEGRRRPAERAWVRVTHGPATDIRSWWPACADYEPAEDGHGEVATGG